MKKRVLIFHPALAPYRIDLFNALNEIYDLQLVFSHRNVPYQRYDQDSLVARLDTDCSYLDRGFSFLGRAIRFGVSDIIKAFRPDVVVTSEFSVLSLQIAFRRGTGRPRQIVWTADNPEIIQAESPLRGFARRLLLPRIDGLIVYSEVVRKFYQDRYSKLPLIGISPNAQSEQNFREQLANASERAVQLIREHSLANKIVLLHVGRLAQVKRIDRLLSAFAASLDNCPDAMLVLVGDGPEYDRLKALVRNLGIGTKVIFVGHCEGDDLFAWFNIGSVLALASDFEPWGAVVNEALIAGIPVVCSMEVGAKELLSEGSNGDIVDADDASAFGARLAHWMGRSPVLNETGLQVRAMLTTEPFSRVVEGFRKVIENRQ